MEPKFILIQPEGVMPLYHFMQLAAKIRCKITLDKLTGTYTLPHLPPLLEAVQEQLTMLYN